MRKSFTQLFSIFILMTVFVLQGFGAGAVVAFPDLGVSNEITNFKKSDAVVLTATEAVEPGIGVVRLKEGGTTLTAYQATNSKVTITVKEDGTSEISIDFTGLMEEEVTYTLEVDANFVKAVDDGEASSSDVWSIVVGDYTAPVLATTDPLSPENGETVAVQLDETLTIKFNETVQVAASGQLFIYTDNGTAHGDLFDVVDASDITGGTTNTLTINPNKDFEELSTYYVVIPNGAIVDYNATNDNKNKFAGWLNNTSWVFTTRDATAPEVTSIASSNVANTSFDVVLQLDKPGMVYVLAVEDGDTPLAADFTAAKGMVEKEVAAGSTNVTVSLAEYLNVGDATATTMAEGGTYDIWVITENAETVSPTQSAPAEELADVTTADETKPTVSVLYPADAEFDADVNTKGYLTLKLSEDVEVGTGSIDVYTWDAGLNHELLVSVPASECMVSLINGVTKNDSLYIPVDKSLWVSEATYFVKYNEGIVADPAGNKVAALANTEDWKFTVQDFLAPTYTIVPTDGTDDASEVDPQITITFNEAIFKDASGTAMDDAGIQAAITLKTGTTAVTYTTTGSTSTVLKLTIDATKVESNAEFEVSIDTKKIWDDVGNAGTSVDVITFSLKDYEAPVATIATDPEPSDNIIIEFDEKVYKAGGSAITDADVANIVIFRKGTSAAGTIVSATYSVADDGMSFIINPAADLDYPAQYYVRIGAGAVEDAAGNAIALTDATLTVADVVAPTATFSITSTDPVAAPTTVTFTFSEPMATLDGTAVGASDVATALVNLKEDGENIPFTAAWSSTTELVVTAAFGNGKTYTVGVGKSLEDLAGNPFAGISKMFTTWSDVAPAMVSVTPDEDATDQAVDAVITVTFDQIITLTGSGTVTVNGSSSAVAAGTPTVDGAVLTIPTTTDFDTDETVTVTISAGFVENANGDDNASTITWTFDTEDTVAPDYVNASTDPTVDTKQIDVGVSDKLVIVFDEEVELKTGQILIKDANTDVTVQSLTEANAVLKTDKVTLEITPTSALDYGKDYYVVLTAGIVADLAGNNFAGFSGTEWDFKTVANAGAFTVDSSSPADLDDKVVAGLANITVDFIRDIKAGSLSSTAKIILNDGTSDVITDVANSSRFSISGTTLTINALNDIVADKTYKLTLEAGIVKDNFDTPSTAKVITFYTFDNYAPEVESHIPDVDAEDVAVNTTISLTWDEAVFNAADGSAITSADIKTKSIVSIDGGVGTDYTASISGNQWTLTLDNPLAEKTEYEVTVDLSKVEDGESTPNEGTGTYTWSFTVIDATINKPSAFVPTDNTKGTEIKFTVAFDEKGSVYYVVMPSSATAPTAAEVMGYENEIAFAAAGTSAAQTVTGLDSGVKYKAYFVAVDESGNQSTIYTAPEITTADVVKPMIVSMTPANEATEIAKDADLVLTFDEAIAIGGTGHIIIRELATDIIVEDIIVTGSNTTLSNDEKTATITRGEDLGNETAYYVEISAGTFTDQATAPNAMLGVSGSATWSFTTKDTVAPQLEKTYPDYDAADLPEITADETIWIEFNEAVKTPTGVVYVKYATDDVFEVVNASAMTMSDDKMTLSFNLTNVPTEETEFYLDLVDFTVKDEADNAWVNAFAGSTLNDWNFIILDQTPPALASSTPTDGAIQVDITSNITLDFTEGVYETDGTEFTTTTIEDYISIKDAAGISVDYTAVLTKDAGNGVTDVVITPDADLDSETEYTVYISPVVDDRDNISSEITVMFTTKDMTAPTVDMWDPAYDTSFNPKTGVVTVTFTEPIFDESVTTTEGNVITIDVLNENIIDFFTYQAGTITRDVDGDIDSFTSGIDVDFTGTISEDNMVITLTPDEDEAPLTSDGWYRVQLASSKVVDVANNPNTADETIFQIEDHVKPNVDAYAPTGATEADADMTIDFDEDVAIGTGNIYIRNYDNGEVIETISVDATTVSVDGDVATIAHADFPEAMDFFVTADAGTFTDATENANAWDGIATDAIDVWNFSTADAVAPGIIVEGGLYPAPESTNIPLDTELKITFDKKVVANNDSETRWIIIYNEDWTPFEVIDVTNGSNITFGSVTDPVLETNRVVSINHTIFEENSTYYVRVDKGVVKDEAGNLFAGISDDTWMFTTEDNTPPSIVSLTPEDNATEVSAMADLMIEFDREVLPNAAGMIKLYKEEPGVGLGTLIETIDPTSTSVVVDSNLVTIMLKEPMEYETGYYVIVETGSFTNTATSKLPLDPGIATTLGWNFSTGSDVDAPEVVVSPMETELTAADVVLTMDFSENVVLGAGMVTIYDAATDEVVETFDIADAVFTDDTLVTIVPTALSENMSYYVMVDAGIVVDLAGNDFAGISDKTTWTFATIDVTVPTVDMLSPDDETIEDNHPTFEMVMSEDVQLTEAGGSIHVIPADGDGTAILDIALTAEMITDNVIKIEYVYDETIGGLAVNAAYYVTVDADAIEDMSGNAFAGISDPAEWTFTTGADLATGVVDPVSDSLEFKVYPNPFSEYVKVENADKLSRIIISNVAGQRVKDIVSPTETIQTGDLRSGIYFMTLITKDDVVAKTERIVKR